MTRMPAFSAGRHVRTVLVAGTAGAAVTLLPWTAHLAWVLPDRYDTGRWRLSWVGFDLALVACFAAAAWLGWRRHRAAVPVLVAIATLLCADAWFDVTLDWTGPDRWTSVATAVLVELPVAGYLLLRARRALVAGVPTRAVTLDDIDASLADPAGRALATWLERAGPAGTRRVATALGLPPRQVAAELDRLERAGRVRRSPLGRWSTAPVNLTWPRTVDVPDGQRDRYRAVLEARLDHELRVLARAARERDRHGDWVRMSRSSAHLTTAELDRLHEEYLELVLRYSLPRRRPAGTREVALRFYAFPQRVVEAERVAEGVPLPPRLNRAVPGSR